MSREERRSMLFNRIQVCGLAAQMIVDHPEQADDNQRRAANIGKQLNIIAAEVRELLAIDAPIETEVR